MAESKYSQIDKEALAVVFGIKKFHQYLYGRHFTILTDHKPLVSIFGKKHAVPLMVGNRMQRYCLLLLAYDYDIKYVKSSNNNADFLSRLPIANEEEESNNCSILINYISNQTWLPITMKNLQNESNKDSE